MTAGDAARWSAENCAWQTECRPLDWIVARRAVFCAGQNGCKAAVACCECAQEMFIQLVGT